MCVCVCVCVPASKIQERIPGKLYRVSADPIYDPFGRPGGGAPIKDRYGNRNTHTFGNFDKLVRLGGSCGVQCWAELVPIYVPFITLRSSSDDRTFRIPTFKRKQHGGRALCFSAAQR